jgi:hypothetical protein
MTPKDFIEERLRRLSTPTPPPVFKDDEERIDHIKKALLSKKFRKYAVDDEFGPHLDSVLRNAMAEGKPIQFVQPFGGYKLWRFEEAPEADWAELFAMMYYALWLKPVVEAYAPGVVFDFSSDDVVVERMNHIPKADTEAYKRTFEEVIAFLSTYLPKNLQFTFTPVGSRYTKEEFDTELDAKMAAWLQEHHGELPVASDADKAMMDLNAHKTPEEEADPEWYGKNKLMHDCYMTVDKRRPYNRAPDKILAFTKQLPKGIAIGTTKTSIAKYWAGVGALKRRDDSFIESVLSPDQLASTKAEWVSLSFPGLSGKNYQKIRVV